MVSGRKLYACYGPQVLRPSDVRTKIREDFAKALANRAGDFGTFVFVRNELRGLPPEVTKVLSELAREHPQLEFENCGLNRMAQMLRRLDVVDVEDLLGPFPAKEAVTGVELAELAPLLGHLASRRERGTEPDTVPIPPRQKLEYKSFGEDTLFHLRRALAYVPLVRDYYVGLANPFERDEVAAAFRREYLVLEGTTRNPTWWWSNSSSTSSATGPRCRVSSTRPTWS